MLLIRALLITVDRLERAFGSSFDTPAIGLCCFFVFREDADGVGDGRLRRGVISGFFSFSGDRGRIGTGEEGHSWKCSTLGGCSSYSKYSPGSSSIARRPSTSSLSSEILSSFVFVSIWPLDSVLILSVTGDPPSCRVTPVNLEVSFDNSANVCLVDVNIPPWSIKVSWAQACIVARFSVADEMGGC